MTRCVSCVEKKLRRMIRMRDLEIKRLEAESQRLRKAATEYGECVSNNIPRASVRYDNACRKLGEALKEKGDE